MALIRALPAGLCLLYLQRRFAQRYPMLLESIAEGSPRARWNMLLLHHGPTLQLGSDGITRRESGVECQGSFLSAFDTQWAEQRRPWHDQHYPFRGGWGMFLSYEVAAQIEPSLRLKTDPDFPIAFAFRSPAAILVDRVSGETLAIAEQGHADLLDSIAQDVQSLQTQTEQVWPAAQVDQLTEAPADQFTDGVNQILDYLGAGDVFQVNLSRLWSAQLKGDFDAFALYQALRTANPAPFSGLFTQAHYSVCSSSPERLISVRGRRIDTRPIAGTRPRVPGDDEQARISELIGHVKERAEHVMLIDLERNDLGRVAKAGSVHVDELMSIESYAHVHHIVSNVTAELRDEITPGQAIAATFPGGTITGCPKHRCMQIIAELEDEPRKAYTGAMGYINSDGDLDLNILIRSFCVQGRKLEFRAGAGIVIDSVPELELQETRAKAKGLLRAIGVMQ